ncbi:hypothetical protein BsWGS_15330 [Bradybaena similaris]
MHFSEVTAGETHCQVWRDSLSVVCQVRSGETHFHLCARSGLVRLIFICVPGQVWRDSLSVLCQVRSGETHFHLCARSGLVRLIFICVPGQAAISGNECIGRLAGR